MSSEPCRSQCPHARTPGARRRRTIHRTLNSARPDFPTSVMGSTIRPPRAQYGPGYRTRAIDMTTIGLCGSAWLALCEQEKKMHFLLTTSLSLLRQVVKISEDKEAHDSIYLCPFTNLVGVDSVCGATGLSLNSEQRQTRTTSRERKSFMALERCVRPGLETVFSSFLSNT